MKKTFGALALALLAAALPASVTAKQGAPHTFAAKANYSTVELSWQSPQSPKQLKYHNDYDYDGDAGRVTSKQHPAVIYIAADFKAADLTPGDVITSLNYFEYRPTLSVTALIYENGNLVREAAADLSGYKADQWRTVTFDQPYTIPANTDIRVGFRIEHGSNLDFVAIMDKVHSSNGDLRSYDGKTWEHNGRGSYLITANLLNEVDEEPICYSVYSGSTLVSDSVQDTSFTLYNQPDGTREYSVKANYGTASYGISKTVTTLAATNYLPTPSLFSAGVEGTGVNLSWRAPLMRGSDNLLSWHSSADSYGNSIGGTASSNTKVWVKNEFTSGDLISFAGAKITGIRAHFHEKTAKSIIAYVMVDGVISQYDTVPEAIISNITADQWVTFPLSQPVQIDPGHTYAYGYYLMHTPKTHPVSVNNAEAVNSKGNAFSTSSPNNKNFANSKPTWKLLSSGNIAGNWMIAAELDSAAAYGNSVASYNLYRNGETVKQGLTTLTYADEVSAPGIYNYTIETVGADGKTSEPMSVSATVKVSEDYRAPIISKSNFNTETGVVDFSWDMDVELKHHGDVAFKAGFDEEMTLNWGSRFTKEELTEYVGYSIKKLNFIIGEAISNGFKLQIHDSDGNLLHSTDFAATDVDATVYYSLQLDTPVVIPANKDLIFSYYATLPGKCSAMVLDEGPLVTGGAVVRLAGASNWMNLGTINSTYNAYNLVISAIAAEPASEAPARNVTLGSTGIASDLKRIELSADNLRQGFGIESEVAPAELSFTQTPRMAIQKPERFNVYRNNELIASSKTRTFSEEVPGYDNFVYQVSAIYNNVWESAQSEGLTIANDIRQASPAPYDLVRVGDKGLSWQAPENAPVLTYCTEDPTSYGVGMTGGTTRTTYAMQKFPADSIASNAGNLVSHIRFGLYSTNLTYAAVIIIKDLGIAYEQEIPVANLKKIQDGWNEIRLNEPFEIEAGHDYMFGYRLDYRTGEKPMLFDAGPANNNLGNLISATASHTSWKSLKSLNSSLDGNWRIYTTLMRPAAIQRMAPRPAEGLTYNVYRNGVKILQGLTATTATPEWLSDAANIFTVTAVSNGVESAHSNAVGTDAATVDGLEATAAIYYDAATSTLVTDCAGIIYDAAGRALLSVPATDTQLSDLAAGTYIFRTSDGRTLKFLR